MKTFDAIIPCVLVLLLLGACRREADLHPISRTDVISGSAFTTAERIEAMINGVYQSVKHGQFYGGRYIIYNEIRADNFINRTNNGVTGLQTWELNVVNGSNEVINLWQRAYIAINNANLFIDGMTEGGTDIVGEPLASQYLGEARFVRALCYYSLLQLYARPYWDGNGSAPGLPLRLTGNEGVGDYSLARSTVGEVYAQILEDLDFAEQNLPESNSSAELNTTRAHRNSAIAFKTRVYLSMQNYEGVISESNKIVSMTAPFSSASGVNHALNPSVADVFTAYTSSESIFSLPMAANSNPGGQNALQYYYMGNVEYNLNEDGIIANESWGENDARRQFIGTGTGGAVLEKFQVPNPWTDYVPVIRYSEVLLSLSEAIVRSGGAVDARSVALLNAVRQRSDPANPYQVGQFQNAEALISAILLERNIEFLGEGLRSPDLLRLGQPIPAKGVVGAVTPSQQQYIWPISANELLYNSLMTDN